MPKAPAFQFYVKDWLSDPELQCVSASSRGMWIDALCYMWQAPERGRLTGTEQEIAKLLRATNGDFTQFINDLKRHKFADVKIDGPEIILTNRRMIREELERNGSKIRQQRFREKGGGDPDQWTAIRIPILQRDDYMCVYCGRKADTVDHVFPKSKGGDENPLNLVACCKRCNMKKGNGTLEKANMNFWKGYINQDVIEYNTNITPPSPSPSPKEKKKEKKVTLLDDEWLKTLEDNSIYRELEVRILYGKMLVWCENNGKKPTRRRFVNWLNREDKPLKPVGGKSEEPKGKPVQRCQKCEGIFYHLMRVREMNLCTICAEKV